MCFSLTICRYSNTCPHRRNFLDLSLFMGKIALETTVSLWVIAIAILVNRIVPKPYMVKERGQFYIFLVCFFFSIVI